MSAPQASPVQSRRVLARRSLRSVHTASALPGAVIAGLLVVWAARDGGYNPTTWYWGALLVLALVAVTFVASGTRRPLGRASVVALAAFAGYTAWSYLTIAWSQTPGWALEGSNRTLLYLLVFALCVMLPWTAESAFGTLLVFVLGVGAIEAAMVVHLALGEHLDPLFSGGRLIAPTGYVNSSAALFMINAMLATALAARRRLPALLRGSLIAIAGVSLQLCVLTQSRGWLYTVPLVIIVAIAVLPNRLRVSLAPVLPLIATLVSLRTLLHVYHPYATATLQHAAGTAGRMTLLTCAGLLLAGTCIAWADRHLFTSNLSPRWRRSFAAVVALLALVLAGGGALTATHGHPIGYITREWDGFTHPEPVYHPTSHFDDVGSARFDFWRVSMDAVAAHPIGGLGQDNFADYYMKLRRTHEEPRWTHSLELRLLAHTGVVGFLLFAVFMIAAVAAAVPALRTSRGLTRMVASASMLPLVVWLIHGSLDWFWEIPVLTGAALGFLGLAASLGAQLRHGRGRNGDSVLAESRGIGGRRSRRRVAASVPQAAGAVAFLAAVFVLALPYLAVQETASALDLRQGHAIGALDRLVTAAELNPLDPTPPRIGGAIALQIGQFTEAEKRFRQTITREPGGWFAWFGDGLAASAVGENARAQRDFMTAASINKLQPVIREALAALQTAHPLTPDHALQLLASSAFT